MLLQRLHELAGVPHALKKRPAEARELPSWHRVPALPTPVLDAFTTVVTPTGCEVMARDQTGNPVITRRRLGKGQVIAVNFALEHIAMTKLPNVFEGEFSNELWRIYAAAAKAAGVRRAVTREDTRLVLTEHPRPDGSRLVCALNTRPEPVSVHVAVDGTVGTVWNGRYVDGKLEIAANDGCMFEVK